VRWAKIEIPYVGLPEMLRTFDVYEDGSFMFFLGAGASVQAGIPSASDMIWMFKRDIYCTETGTGKEAFNDLTLKRHRQRLQQYFDNRPGHPRLGNEKEYSFYFERAYPTSESRRQFIRKMIRQSVPTIGYDVLGFFLAEGKIKWIWTTNFDDLVEKSERPDTEQRLFVITPESVNRLQTSYWEHSGPFLVKLHGDYRYDALQNTSKELQALEQRIQSHLVLKSQEHGMIVIGYSGRDESVMFALEQVVKGDGSLVHPGFRHGLYWCIRRGEEPNERLRSLIEFSAKRSGQGGFVEIDNFDDLMFRLYKQCGLKDSKIDKKGEKLFQQRQPFVRFIPNANDRPQSQIKLNAIKVTEFSTSPYVFPTNIISWNQLRELIQDQPIKAGLTRGKVVAFGNRERIRTVFDSMMTGPMEVGDIQPKDLRRAHSVYTGLYYDIIDENLVRKWELQQLGKGHTFFIPYDGRSEIRDFEFTFNNRRYKITPVTRNEGYFVNEAFTYQLAYNETSLWFLLEPTVVITSDGSTLAPVEVRRRLTNKILASRYNDRANDLLLFWLHYLRADQRSITFSFPLLEETGFHLVLDTHYAFSSRR